MTPVTRSKLFDACDTFARVANIVDALPTEHRPSNQTPARDVLPGIWPTVGDLRRLRDEMVVLGWSNDYRKPSS